MLERRNCSPPNAATACAASGVLFPNFLPSDRKFGFASRVTRASPDVANSTPLDVELGPKQSDQRLQRSLAHLRRHAHHTCQRLPHLDRRSPRAPPAPVAPASESRPSPHPASASLAPARSVDERRQMYRRRPSARDAPNRSRMARTAREDDRHDTSTSCSVANAARLSARSTS